MLVWGEFSAEFDPILITSLDSSFLNADLLVLFVIFTNLPRGLSGTERFVAVLKTILKWVFENDRKEWISRLDLTVVDQISAV